MKGREFSPGVELIAPELRHPWRQTPTPAEQPARFVEWLRGYVEHPLTWEGCD
jgi:hypothetical protein